MLLGYLAFCTTDGKTTGAYIHQQNMWRFGPPIMNDELFEIFRLRDLKRMDHGGYKL